MSKKPTSEVPESRVLTEEQVSSLIAQFRFMLLEEVKNMKLEVVETIGGMLARRSGIDRELHDLSSRVDLLAAAVEGFGVRLFEVEKAHGIESQSHKGPIGKARDLARG